MKVTVKSSAVKEPKHRKRPDFSGVPGELVEASALPVGLAWGAKRRLSPYDAPLKSLVESPERVLRFADTRAITSVHSRAKRLEIAIETAVDGGVLYVRLKEISGDAGQKRREQIRIALKLGGPRNPAALASVLREKGDAVMDAQMALAILRQMGRVGEVFEQEGGMWTLNPKHKP